MSDILKQTDVWFVTNYQAIQWIQKPTPLNELKTFQPWKCNKYFNDNELACNIPNVCKVFSRVFQQDRYFYTCAECPPKYPWIRNEFGLD